MKKVDINKTLENLRKKGYTASSFQTAQEAVEYMNREINEKTVGMGGSTTINQIGLYEKLAPHNQVFWHWRLDDTELSEKEIYAEAQKSDVYISSVNGMSEGGEIINIDGFGNRISACLYGHEKVYFVVGINKLAATYEGALWRARNIAAPKNAQRIHKNTPCAENGDRCFDCRSEERICRGLSVLWYAINSCKMEVILIEENLGF